MTTDSFERLLKKAAHVSTAEMASLAPTLHPGSTLLDGRLRIVRRVGEGGMGIVYEAHDAQRRSSVALKTLNRLDAANVYRLKNEFRSLADVSHPGLCRLYELFGERGQWFFTMELIDGERFDQWVRPAPGAAFDGARLRAALPQLLDAIAAIHAQGKLHRDLKPSNVLVTRDGRVVVLDFGLAVDPELGGVGQTVLDGSVSGTPGYMSPEQAASQPTTAASDLYALGAMLFEALTGRLPFIGHAHEILTDKQRLEAPRASTLAAGVPSDLDALCASLLAREPSARPAVAALRVRLGAASEVPSRSVAQRVSDSSSPARDARLFGRDGELELLREAHRAACSGKPTVVFVSGESGMGKSALIAAFLEELRAEGNATVLAGRCHERENVPFKGFDSLVDELSRHLRKLPVHEAAAVLPREAYALARIFPVLERVSAVAESPKRDVADPQELKSRAFAAFGELLARMRDRAPLVAFIDDLQWLDLDSVRFMRALFVHADPVPLLLIGAHRSEGARDNSLLQSVRQAAADNPALSVRTLEIGGLSAGALRDLIGRMRPEGGERDATRLAEQAQGSPFLAAVLARVSALPSAEGPASSASLGDALTRHVGALAPGARKLLSLLALAGQPLSSQLVIDAAGLADGHDRLDDLGRQQLTRVAFDAAGARSVECYHDKIREHVAGALDPLLTRELALALARALLALPNADPELLARCFDLAGLAEDAAVHFARAADAALAALAFDRAAMLYTKALDHGRFDDERAQTLHVGRAQALACAGRGVDAADAYLAAAEHAQGEAVEELELRAGEQYLLCGRLKRGRELLDRTLRRAGMSLPQSLPGAFAGVLWSRTRMRLRGSAFTPRDDQDAKPLWQLDLLRVVSRCLVRSDQLRAADFNARWLLRALQAGHSVEVARALSWEVMLRSMMGADLAQVQLAIAQCDELCERTGDLAAASWLAYTRGLHELSRGAGPAEGLRHFERSLELHARNAGATAAYDRAWIHYFRASSLWMLGRFEEAGEVAYPTFEDAVTRGDHTVAISLSNAVAVCALARDRPDQAERVLIEAEAWLPPDEIAVQHMIWLFPRWSVGIYQGRAADSWRETAAHREAYFASWQGRVVMGATLRTMGSGTAWAASIAGRDPQERQALGREARRLIKGVADVRGAGVEFVPPATLRACIDGDRPRAIAALRRCIPSSQGPLITQLFRRRLGELLQDAEGAALIAEADAFLRAGGVVDPERFTRAMTPGLEIPT